MARLTHVHLHEQHVLRRHHTVHALRLLDDALGGRQALGGVQVLAAHACSTQGATPRNSWDSATGPGSSSNAAMQAGFRCLLRVCACQTARTHAFGRVCPSPAVPQIPVEGTTISSSSPCDSPTTAPRSSTAAVRLLRSRPYWKKAANWGTGSQAITRHPTAHHTHTLTHTYTSWGGHGPRAGEAIEHGQAQPEDTERRALAGKKRRSSPTLTGC